MVGGLAEGCNVQPLLGVVLVPTWTATRGQASGALAAASKEEGQEILAEEYARPA